MDAGRGMSVAASVGCPGPGAVVRVLGIPRHAKELQRRCGLDRLPFAEISTLDAGERVERGSAGHIKAGRVGGVRTQARPDGQGRPVVGFEVYSSDLHRRLFVELGPEDQVDEARARAVVNSTHSEFYLACVLSDQDGNLEW